MRTTGNEVEYQPMDYRIERWIVRLLALLFLLPFVVQAQASQEMRTTTLAAFEDAALLLETSNPGVYAIAPTIRTVVEIKVTGPIVRTRVQQTFRNTSGRRVEGLYVYPLPEMSSVDATITAGREATGQDPRTAMRQAFITPSFDE